MSSELSKSDFPYLTTITTRWHDNDIYGHVNNVVYYSFFDTAVNRYMIEEAGLDIHTADIIAYVVSSNCNYFAGISYPENIDVGIRVKKLGNSSVHYEIGVFSENDSANNKINAFGEFVHVFVERASGKSTAIPAGIRTQLQQLTY